MGYIYNQDGISYKNPQSIDFCPTHPYTWRTLRRGSESASLWYSSGSSWHQTVCRAAANCGLFVDVGPSARILRSMASQICSMGFISWLRGCQLSLWTSPACCGTICGQRGSDVVERCHLQTSQGLRSVERPKTGGDGPRVAQHTADLPEQPGGPFHIRKMHTRPWLRYQRLGTHSLGRRDPSIHEVCATLGASHRHGARRSVRWRGVNSSTRVRIGSHTPYPIPNGWGPTDRPLRDVSTIKFIPGGYHVATCVHIASYPTTDIRSFSFEVATTP